MLFIRCAFKCPIIYGCPLTHRCRNGIALSTLGWLCVTGSFRFPSSSVFFRWLFRCFAFIFDVRVFFDGNEWLYYKYSYKGCAMRFFFKDHAKVVWWGVNLYIPIFNLIVIYNCHKKCLKILPRFIKNALIANSLSIHYFWKTLTSPISLVKR